MFTVKSLNIKAPLYVYITKSKKFALNLNNYRNAHFYALAKAKKIFKSVMKEQIYCLPIYNKVHIIYTLHPKTKRLVDVANVCSIVDKFFSDALVELNKIEDDNYKFVHSVEYKFGYINKEDPHVGIEIQQL